MEPIRTLLIDDEAEARQLLRRLLCELELPLAIVGEADDVATGLRAVRRCAPDLIFLDVNLKSGTGFDLLNQLPRLEAEVIFVTAYDQYALRAFDFAAIGYLLKPLSLKDLRRVVERFTDSRRAEHDPRLGTLLDNRRAQRIQHVIVPDQSGFRVLKLPNIVYLRGEVNYTRFILTDGSELLSSKTLKEYEGMLTGEGFCRIHQSYLINLSHVTAYQRGEGGVVTLTNGVHLDVSRRRKRGFMERMV